VVLHKLAQAKGADGGLAPRQRLAEIGRYSRQKVIFPVEPALHVVTLQKAPRNKGGTAALQSRTQKKPRGGTIHVLFLNDSNTQNDSRFGRLRRRQDNRLR